MVKELQRCCSFFIGKNKLYSWTSVFLIARM